MVSTPWAPRSCVAVWIRSALPHDSILKPRSIWNFLEAASAPRHLNDCKQYSNLHGTNKQIQSLLKAGIYIFDSVLIIKAWRKMLEVSYFWHREDHDVYAYILTPVHETGTRNMQLILGNCFYMHKTASMLLVPNIFSKLFVILFLLFPSQAM